MNCLDIIAVNPTTELPGRSLIPLFSTCICFIFFVNKMPVNNGGRSLVNTKSGGKLVIFEALFKSLPSFQCS